MPANFGFIRNYGSTGTGNTNFVDPLGFGIDNQYIYIADSGNDRIIKRRLFSGEYIDQVGSNGSGDLNFDTPADALIIGPRLFVADSVNDRIQVFNKHDLSFFKTIGSSGSGNGQLNDPRSMFTDGEFLYILDSTNNRIVKFNLNNFSFDSNVSIDAGSGNQAAYDSKERLVYIPVGTTKVSIRSIDSLATELDTIVAADTAGATLAGLVGIAVKDFFVYLMLTSTIEVLNTTTFATETSYASSGTDNIDIGDGNYIKAVDDVLIFSDQSNERMNIWYNYDPERAITPASGITADKDVGGQLSMIAGEDVVIAGTSSQTSPTNQWVRDTKSQDRYGWSR